MFETRRLYAAQEPSILTHERRVELFRTRMNLTQNRKRLLQVRGFISLMRWCSYLIVFSATLGFLGCTATYFSGSSDAPGNYRVYVHVRGSYGRSFLDQTEKAIR